MSSASDKLLEEVKRLQRELQETQARLQSVADVSGTLIAKLEFLAQPEGPLLLVGSDAMADQLLGKDCAALWGQALTALFPGLRGSTVPEAIENVARTGQALPPMRLLGDGFLSGRTFNYFVFQLAANRAVVKFWECTETQHIQSMDMRAQQQLAAVFNHSPAAISLTRESDGVYVDVNDEWSRLTGLTLNDVYALQASAPLITKVSPEYRIPRPTISANGKTFRPFVSSGAWPVVLEFFEHEIGHGRMFNEIDEEQGRSVCVIGTSIRDELFGSPAETGQEIIPVGESLTINGQAFTIVGMFKHYESEQERK